MRRFTIQPLYLRKSVGAELRLRGKWLCEVFQPGDRVVIEISDGKLVVTVQKGNDAKLVRK